MRNDRIVLTWSDNLMQYEFELGGGGGENLNKKIYL